MLTGTYDKKNKTYIRIGNYDCYYHLYRDEDNEINFYGHIDYEGKTMGVIGNGFTFHNNVIAFDHPHAIPKYLKNKLYSIIKKA